MFEDVVLKEMIVAVIFVNPIPASSWISHPLSLIERADLLELLRVLMVSVLAFSSVAFAGLYFTQKRELSRLKEAVRSFCRGVNLPNRVRFRTKEAEGLWRSILMLGARDSSVERCRDVYDEAITLSARLAGSADEESNAAEALVDVLIKQTGPELVGVAVVLRDGTDDGLQVVSSAGVPKRRTETQLLICFDAVTDASRKDVSIGWGYHLPEDDPCFDFSVFGIGLCLLVPLRDGEGICGGVWLGFKKRGESLPPRRKEFIQAMAEHAAASFYAARKARERTERSDRERDFLLGMSHDLRAPGNRALYAARDLLAGRMGKLTSEQYEHIEAVEHAIEEQLGLLSDVLDYTRHRKGFLEARRMRFSLRAALDRTVADYRDEATKQGLILRCESIPDIVVEVDPGHLRRMITNLLSNAVKYTDDGKVSVSFHRVEDRLTIMVADTGIGVQASERHWLFEEFRRGKRGEKKEGVGLGLALTKALAELNGGKVFYRPNPQGGSVFGIEIPCLSSEAERPRCTTVNLRSILVVDDDPAACRTIIRYIRDMADVVVPAGSVWEAIDIVKGLKPELIVSDLNLGDGDASEIFMRIADTTRRIVVTGSSGVQMEDSGRVPPGTVFLEKPVERQVLRQAILGLFRHEESERRGSAYATH